MQIVGRQGQQGGRDLVLGGMESDLTAGVRQRLRHTVAGRDLTIWEMDLLSPADNPTHCPPSAVWLVAMDQGRVQNIRLYHPQV
ncbi:MAG: polymerase ECF-subfamily sigma factor [Amycolatopsis sp.]|nr:polymerase ECF-subfamily sigma factor [Amycolatopsis sp.]